MKWLKDNITLVKSNVEVEVRHITWIDHESGTYYEPHVSTLHWSYTHFTPTKSFEKFHYAKIIRQNMISSRASSNHGTISQHLISMRNPKPKHLAQIRHCGLVGSAPACDETDCEFNSWQCRIYIPCSLSLRLHLGPFGFSGYIWLDTKIVFTKLTCPILWTSR